MASADRFFDFTADGRATHPYDDYGHGTHVATLIGGEGEGSELDVERFDNGKRHRARVAVYRGVAPKARIISLKVLDANGAGYTSSVLSAIGFAIENRQKLKIDIITSRSDTRFTSLPSPTLWSERSKTPPAPASSSSHRLATTVRIQETGEVGYAGYYLARQRSLCDYGWRTGHARDCRSQRRYGCAV